MSFEKELAVGMAAVKEAGKYVMSEYTKFTAIPDAPAGISTHVDRESQEIILKLLHNAYPDYGLIAEEATPTLADSPVHAERTWIVDPIDGTRGFAVKNGEFSVMLGLVVHGKPVLGIVYEPVIERLTYAAQGIGCLVKIGDAEPQSCTVSQRAEAIGCTLVQSRSKEGKKAKPGVISSKPALVIETYSAGIKMAIVARGEADVYVNYYANFHDWDICPGHALIELAGGKITGFDNEEITYGIPPSIPRRGLVASNGQIHSQFLELLNQPTPAG